MSYYQDHSQEYIDNTFMADMSTLYAFFLNYVKDKRGKLLDLGFGSGRDSLYFKKIGFEVVSLDPTISFCQKGRELKLNVICQKAEDMTFNNELDCIWACASLLHVKKEKLSDVFSRCFKALKEDGIMYCSFKYGDFNGVRNERFFVDLTEDSLKSILKETQFKILEIKITYDVRPSRDDKWLNVILKK